MTPPRETFAKLEIGSGFLFQKSALCVPLPPFAEATKSQSSPKLHERIQTKIFSLREEINRG